MGKKKAKKLVITAGILALTLFAPVHNNPIGEFMGTMTNTIEAQAAEVTFSSYWYQDSEGHWKIRDGSGNIIRNAWLCDDAVAANGQNVWYLLDANGNMISAGLVQDQTGNYYSLEMNHNGYYGMLRYQSGNYDGINLELENSHSGSFAAIKNQDGIEALKEKYSLTVVNIDNSNCVYTSTFKNSSSSSSKSTVTETIQTENKSDSTQEETPYLYSSISGSQIADFNGDGIIDETDKIEQEELEKFMDEHYSSSKTTLR